MNTKKIEKKHLDKSLITWLLGLSKSKSITYEDLSKELQKIIRTGGDTSGYNDAPILEDIKELKDHKVDKDSLSSFFNKKEDKINLELLDDNLQGYINAIKRIKATNIDTARLKTEPILFDDLEPSLQNRIANVANKIDKANELIKEVNKIADQVHSAGGDNVNTISTLSDKVTELENKLNEANTTIEQLTNNASENQRIVESAKTTINQINNDLLNGSGSNATIKDNKIPSNIARMSDINNLQSQIAILNSNQNFSSTIIEDRAKKEIIIEANQKIEYSLEEIDPKLAKKSIKLLLKDTDSDSRTYNMYINPEGSITYAFNFEEKKLIIFNDNNTRVELIMLY